MGRKKSTKLPSPGDAFAVPLEDGRYSVCRVILDASSDAARRWNTNGVLVACSAWVGSELPRPDDPALRPILRRTHHSWTGALEMAWISEPVPRGFIPLGRIPPTPEEMAIACGTFGGWASMAEQPLMQWRWDHARAGVLDEDQEGRAKAVARREEAATRRRAYLTGVALADLSGHTFFPRWKDDPAAGAVRASRALMATTVRRLIDLGESASEEDRRAVLRACVESFNELDAKLGFIDTVAREDICEEFEAVVHACGLGRYVDLVDEWREW
ncbi:MAG TPA: hypothetical protein VD866_21090 [Urbifossiella sp.]|nr:hypothetical protein [Urbifossiella sp.]